MTISFLKTSPSVNLSKLADLLRMIVILGLISFLLSLSMFSSFIFAILAKPFLERIWALLKTREMHYPFTRSGDPRAF